jgi:choline dehydrogenase
MGEDHDFVVIGAGSTGCALAYRLVTETGARTLLIEAGGQDTRAEIHNVDVPSTLSLWGAPELDWGYVTVPQEAASGRSIPVARGKLWGGSSSINAMVHVRGNPGDFDHWNHLGNEGWSYADVLPYFKRMENFEGGESAYRGAGGPLSVIVHGDPTPVADRFLPAAVEIGFEDRGSDFDFNAQKQDESPFYYQATKTRDQKRASTAVAYLHPILKRPNFTLLSNAQVTRLVVDGTRVVGVEYVKDGQVERVSAAQEVIVCGGSYESPKLLMLSGIGPARTLDQHGIPVVADLPGVGQNLQDHVIVNIANLSRQGLPWPISLIAETGLFTRTRPGLDHASPDLQIALGAMKYVPPEYDKEGPGFTFAVILVQPQSVGYLTLRSADPLDTAILQPNFLREESDVAVFDRGIELVRELVHTRAMKDFFKEELAPGGDVIEQAALRRFVRDNASTVWHAVGTCKMGHDGMAVVDPQLRVRGVQGLRIADASVMPRVVAGNTNAACVMIGEKAADMIRAANC